MHLRFTSLAWCGGKDRDPSWSQSITAGASGRVNASSDGGGASVLESASRILRVLPKFQLNFWNSFHLRGELLALAVKVRLNFGTSDSPQPGTKGSVAN